MPLAMLPTSLVLLPTGSPHEALPMQLPSLELARVCGPTDTKHLVPVTFYLPVLKRALVVPSISHDQLSVTYRWEQRDPKSMARLQCGKAYSIIGPIG